MTDKEILDGNKLIAEFMGYNTDELAEKDEEVRYFCHNHLINTSGIPDWNTTDEDWTSYLYPDEMRFHSSWDWLIPVIGKITSECEEPEELGSLRLHLITNDILYAWKFVVNYLSDKQ